MTSTTHGAVQAEATRLEPLVGRWVDSVVVAEALDSSQELARRLMDQTEAEGIVLRPTLVVVHRQSAGRGRGDRSWSSPRGGLYLSWMRSGLEPSLLARLPLVATAAAWEAVAGLGLEGVVIKWPNDLMLSGAKLAGLLIHARHGDDVRAAVGLGVNVAVRPPADELGGLPATSLAEHLGARPWDEVRTELITGFVSALSRFLEQPDAAVELWRRRLVHGEGERLSVRLASGEILSGEYLGTTPEGHLRLDAPSGEHVITGGDVVETAERS